jgi:hypothetical protein
MCTDPTLYSPDDFWKAQGLTEEEQVRHEVLWQAARNGETPIHIGKCSYCAELLASFQRMNGVISETEPIIVAVCPDAESFSRYYYGERNPKIEEHLKTCTACREDLAFLARSQEPREKALPLKRKLMWLGAAAAALIYTLMPWPWNKKPAPAAPIYQASNKYANLAEPPVVDKVELMRIAAPDHYSRIEQVLDAYDKGDYKKAEEYADIIYRAVEDPAAAYLRGMAQYKQNKIKEAYISMWTAERIQPITEYRCWNALQLALMVGDRADIERELRHVGSDPKYADRCAKIKAALQG